MTALNHVSQNRLCGSLLDTPIPRVLDACHRHMVTGWIKVSAGRSVGLIELRGGAIDAVRFGELRGAAALERLRRLGDGDYEVVQRLPGLDGSLGSAAAFQGELSDVSLNDLMRHCEDNALNCTITLIHGFDRGQIVYHLGEIELVQFNGAVDEDAIVVMMSLEKARFRVSAPPLDIGIDGWPSVRREPTAPFTIEHLVKPERASSRSDASLPGVFETPAVPMGKRRQRLATGTGCFDSLPDQPLDADAQAGATWVASGRTVPLRADTSSVITSATPEAIDNEFRPKRASAFVRLRLSLARFIAGQPIEPSVAMIPGGRRFERAAFALLRWLRA